MSKVEKFLQKHHQSSAEIDIGKKVKEVLEEMQQGLEGKGCLPMIPTYIGHINNVVRNSRRLLIDAGGTNFRAAVGYFDYNGSVVIEDVIRTSMPATNGRLTKEQFYDAIANNVKPLLDKCGDVGFCFSYNVKMDKDIDGIVAPFSKEVDAPEVVGSKVGRCTLDAIAKLDKKQRNIVILNDTVATLLGGQANNIDKQFCTYIGYIYGTGLNICYIEDTAAISKLEQKPDDDKMIINIEAGNFNKFRLGDFDQVVVNNTANPGSQLFEKMTSGKYLAEIMLVALQTYKEENNFAGKADIQPFTLKDVSEFLDGQEKLIYSFFDTDSDRTEAKELCRELVDRAARMSAIFNGAVATYKGQPNGAPVAIVAEGTTFHKLTGYRANFEKYLNTILAPHKISYEIVGGDELNLVGTLMATMARN